MSNDSVVGDIITFGNYGGEDISWIILDEEDGKYLVISKYGLEAKEYNIGNDYVTWETCTLRFWLNDEFYNEAFSSSEQMRILTTNVTADHNNAQSVDSGNDTQDNVFLLSIDEAVTYFGSDEDRVCYPTEYALNKGLYTIDEACFWWLRTPGWRQDQVSYVSPDGAIGTFGLDVNYNNRVVRPAMWISAE